MINNIYAVIFIFIYIIFITLLNLYLTLNKKNNYNKVDEKVAVMLYCYGKLSPYKLFKATIMDLINRKYFTIKDGIVEVGSSKVDELTNYEKCAYESIKDLLKKYDSVDELDNYFSTEFAYGEVLNKFYVELKKEVNSKYGRVYKYASFISVIIFTLLLGIQVFSSIKIELPFIVIILLSCILLAVTILVTNLLNRYINVLNFKRYAIICVASLLLSIISYNIWNKNASNDLIIIHVILGIFSYMYPLYLYSCVYFIRTNFLFLNKKQEAIIKYLDNVKTDLLNKKKYTKEDYVYLYGLDVKKRVKEKYLA